MKVIFHGNDFGLTRGINEGIIQSFYKGLLTSASIIAGGEAAHSAIAFAKDNPGLDIGAHLTLCDEAAVLPKSKIPSLIKSGERFYNRNELFLKILKKNIDLNQVVWEWGSQIEKILKEGIKISHIDSHQFVHLFPTLFPVCCRLAKEYNIPFIRSCVKDLIDLEMGFKRLLQMLSLKLCIAYSLSNSSFHIKKKIPTIGFLHAGGNMTPYTFLKTINIYRKKYEVVEIMLHPCITDNYTYEKYRHWGYKWHKDLDFLLDPVLSESMMVKNIIQTSFWKESW